MKNNIGGFINCICTYLSVIYKDLVGVDDYLMFLKDKVILHQDKHVKGDVSHLNPWDLQPYIIGNKKYLFKGMTEQYMEYLEKKLHLRLAWKEKSCFRNQMNGRENIIILPVDEYYVSHSKFYNKKHNHHFLMLFNYSNGKFEYIDSECAGSGKIEYDEVVRAMKPTGEGEKILLVDCSKFKREKRQEFCVFETPLRIPKITEDINTNHYLEALRLSIVFQIKPFVLLYKNYSTNPSKNINELYLLFENLATYLLLGNVGKKIEHIRVTMLIEKINFKIEELEQEEFFYGV